MSETRRGEFRRDEGDPQFDAEHDRGELHYVFHGAHGREGGADARLGDIHDAVMSGVLTVFLFVFVVISAVSGGALAAEAPPVLEALYALEPAAGVDAPAFGVEKRRAAMRLAAIGFGARSGLSRRGYELSLMVERFSPQLSRVYRFGDLMLREHGFTLLPPVLAETRDAFRLGRDQRRAASAERVLAIVEGERIVSAAPGWRDFLLREWAAPVQPASVLFPRDEAETALWRGWLAEGWVRGVVLAEDIFASDLDRLNAAFEGVVRWHRLHLARMVSAPVVGVEDKAVGGSARLVRIGERRVRLEGRAALSLDPGEWRALPVADEP